MSVCLHLLIADSAAYFYVNYYRYYDHEERLPILLNTVECSSVELQFSQYNHTRFNGIFWYDERFGVRCQITRESKN